MSFSNLVVVLDINGVLGEVSKRTTINIKEKVRLPSGQVFYLNPSALYFIARLIKEHIPLVLWTSRVFKNAKPIEEMYPLSQIWFLEKMHGEDCITVKGSFHPIKKAATLREHLQYTSYKDSHFIFVDDSPKYVQLDDNSEVICCETYKATENNYSNLTEVLSKIINNGKTF